MERCWILVGMMGSGKTSVGRELAHRTGRQFVDTDHLIQHQTGMTVAEIFDSLGESEFRRSETEALRSLRPSAAVVATGGGIVTRDENWVEMRRIGTTLFLDVSWERLAIRLRRSRFRRPLLASDDWRDKLRTLWEARRPLYLRADVRVEIDRQSVAEVARMAHRALEAFESGQVS
ncbi:MAG: shikimate kinase [Fimbriimonadales bacterium]|nr:shikimate kinase [Fimbriimonadales bacterium]